MAIRALAFVAIVASVPLLFTAYGLATERPIKVHCPPTPPGLSAQAGNP